jgi:sugar fermentation stimulation protein A
VNVSIRYDGAPEEVVFLRRPNRFLAIVRPAGGGRAKYVHVPNPGRMVELLVPGVTHGYIIPARRPGRATSATLVSVRHEGTWVSIDTLAANRIVARALRAGAVGALPRNGWRPEFAVGHHRFDFARLDPTTGRLIHLLEVKSSNLRTGRLALFPDAPTGRGARHMVALARASRAGVRADVVIAVQRSDVEAFAPNRAMDPVFATAFDRARAAGVRVSAHLIAVRPDGLRWGRRVPVVEGGRPNIFKRHGSNAGR